MIIKKAELERVCGITSKLPDNSLPEVAFAGKSNVGKSSMINALMIGSLWPGPLPSRERLRPSIFTVSTISCILWIFLATAMPRFPWKRKQNGEK